MASSQVDRRFDLDFSLAIHNRTGKYFIGRDLIAAVPDLLGRTYYWMLSLDAPPRGLFGKVVGRLQHLQVRDRALGGVWRFLPRRRPSRPLLHLDPFTTLTTKLDPRDAVLCHDIGPLTEPALFDPDVGRIYANVYAAIAVTNPHMVFVSRASQRAFAAWFPQARPASTRVIYPAIRADLDIGDRIPVAGLEGAFLLTVGSIGARKNQRACIAAFARSGLAARGVRYVLCGGREPGFDAAAAAAEATAGVVLLPYVADAQLRWLYANACGFVLASLLEGFGIPVAEAIARGLVPAVTRDSVLHEVAGDGALLVDASDEEGIAAAMVRLVDMPDGERTARLALLEAAIERFTPERFGIAWRDALLEMTGAS